MLLRRLKFPRKSSCMNQKLFPFITPCEGDSNCLFINLPGMERNLHCGYYVAIYLVREEKQHRKDFVSASTQVNRFYCSFKGFY